MLEGAYKGARGFVKCTNTTACSAGTRCGETGNISGLAALANTPRAASPSPPCAPTDRKPLRRGWGFLSCQMSEDKGPSGSRPMTVAISSGARQSGHGRHHSNPAPS
jgi:hypothetical protein